jgi:hypothetical protein
MQYHVSRGHVYLEDTDLFGATEVAVDLDVPPDRLPRLSSGLSPFWAGSFALPKGKDIILGGPYTLRLDDGTVGEIDVIARSPGAVAHFLGAGPLALGISSCRTN